MIPVLPAALGPTRKLMVPPLLVALALLPLVPGIGLPNRLHQQRGGIPGVAAVRLRVFAEGEEGGVDGHLVHAEEDLGEGGRRWGCRGEGMARVRGAWGQWLPGGGGDGREERLFLVISRRPARVR